MEACEIASVRDLVFRQLVRAAFVFEPLAPTAISYYLAQQLKRWKQQGLILEYRTKTRRLGKFHYKTQVDLELSPEQAADALNDLLLNRLKGIRRWFNV